MYQAVLMAQGRSGTINQNEPAWEDVTYVPSDLTIASGVSLTINGKVKFSEGAHLIIQPGAQVNLYGTLTSSCMGPWEGVIVEGIAGESQYTAGKHGKLYTYDGAVIENAMTGVTLMHGGILYGKSTSFKNDGTGVAYFPYSNFWPFSNPVQPRNHFGSVTNCTFLFNDEFSQAAEIGSGLQMEGVRGINILGCSFLNERTIKNPMSNADYGYGIKASDARFTVASLGIGNTYPPSSYDHSAFKGLGYGVYVGTAQSGINATLNPTDDFVNMPYTVQQAAFSECIYGIHNRFVSQGVIVGNTFNMGKLSPVSSLSGNTPYTNEQFGIFMENGANGFELQENQFVKVPVNVEFAYGSYCQNLGWFNNDIRRNTYTNVNYGNVADEDNAITMPNRGLHYLCNTNTTKQVDFFVYPGGDIRQTQGLEISATAFLAAGNTFSKANAPNGDFANNGPQVRYFYDGLAEKPVYYAGLAFYDVDPNACEVQYCLPPCRDKGEWPALKNEYNTKRDEYQVALKAMQGAILSGNTILADQKSNLAAAYRLRLDDLSNTLSLHMAFDTNTYNVDSVRLWWQRMDSPVSEMVVARDYLAKGKNATAFAVLDAIPAKYALPASGLSDLDNFRSIMQIMQDESVGKLSENKIQELLTYTEKGPGISAAWAKNILTVQGYHFPPLPKHMASFSEKEDREATPSAVLRDKVYNVSPNPARDYVRFTVANARQNEACSIVVTNATGYIIWRSPIDANSQGLIWPTTDVKPGLYFYNVYQEAGPVQSGHIAIVK